MPEEKKSNLSKRLPEALRIRDIKQSELCEKTKIPKSAISQYISGLFEPKKDRISIIAKALNVSEMWLMGYDVPMENNAVPISENNLTEIETAVLELFRQIPKERQQEALELLRIALKMQQKH